MEAAVENFLHYQMITEILVLLDQFVTEEEVEGCSWEGGFVLDEEEKVVMAFVFCDGEEREEGWVMTVLEYKERGRKATLLVIEDEEERKGLSVVEEEEEGGRKNLEIQKERDLYGKCQELLVSLVVLPK